MACTALTAKVQLRGTAVAHSGARVAARRVAAKRAAPIFAKYGDESQYFDLKDLENTVGSWDMYGQEDKSRYNSLQSQFFENAAGSLSRREYILGICSIGAAGILAWGAKGSKDVKLPITKGPQQPAQVGPRGRL